jgi:crossover junction endodeoxyribonuclease RuvC
MLILGVDPGLARTGYGVVERRGGEFRALAHGCVTTRARQPTAKRLKKIHDELAYLVDRWGVDELAVEDVFFAANVKLALNIGHARGVVLLMAVNRGIPSFEYSAREVKQAVVGNGAASKEQVQRMVTQLLGLPQPPEYYDAADALAVALCHGHRPDALRAG